MSDGTIDPSTASSIQEGMTVEALAAWLPRFHQPRAITPEWTWSDARFARGLWDGTDEVVLKVGGDPGDRLMTSFLQAGAPGLAPRLHAGGSTVGTIRAEWMVMERIPHGPLGPVYGGDEFDLLLEARVRLHHATSGHPFASATPDHSYLRSRMDRGLSAGAPACLAPLAERFEVEWAWMAAVFGTSCCHGDFHLANALSRQPRPHGPAVLIDFSPVSAPWVWDLAYLQALVSSAIDRPGSSHLVERYEALLRRDGMEAIPHAELERAAAIAIAWNLLALAADPHWHATPGAKTALARIASRCAPFGESR
jgi:hypothetical protein